MSNCVDPCPCGYYGDSQKPCTCNHSVVTKYQKRISGPILDRKVPHVLRGIDVHTSSRVFVAGSKSRV